MGTAFTKGYDRILSGGVPLPRRSRLDFEGCVVTDDPVNEWTTVTISGSSGGTVTSVALALPAEFTVSGSPVTGAGTLTAAWATEAANLVLAGPGSGGPATPTFRALVAADIPALPYVPTSRTIATTAPLTGGGALSGNLTLAIPKATSLVDGYLSAADWTTFNAKGAGTVTSVALTAPAELAVAGSPVTTTGTLALTWVTESANAVFAGPTSGGAATPTFRALVAADIPALPYVPTARTISTTAPLTGGGDLSANRTIAIPAATSLVDGYLTAADWVTFNSKGSGTVTSVAVTAPSELTVTGSPITTSGTVALTWTSQAANLLLASPNLSSGVPTFRKIVPPDVAAVGGTLGGNGLVTTFLGDFLLADAETDSTLPNLSIDMSSGNLVFGANGDLGAFGGGPGNIGGFGLAVRTSTFWFTRTLIGTAPIVIADGDGLAANPTISLANTAVTAASYGSATQVGTFTVDAKGRLTAAANVTITGTAPGGAAGGDLSGTYPNPTVAKINGVAYNADPLTQYALLGGRAGGQALSGGTLTGQTLQLSANTVDAGTVLLNTSELLVLNLDLGLHNTDNVARYLYFYEPSGSGGNYSRFRAQAQAADLSYTLPAALTTNGLLQTGATGTLQWAAVSGDATLASGGALTLASTITAGGPIGDATHVAQITYDAKGRLTTVASVAITGTAPGGTAGGDLSGTYPNPTVSKINGVAYNADPLAQYLLLAGRAGGQTAIGGTAASEGLTLQSTAHATRGDITAVDRLIGTGSSANSNAFLAQVTKTVTGIDTFETVSLRGTWTLNSGQQLVHRPFLHGDAYTITATPAGLSAILCMEDVSTITGTTDAITMQGYTFGQNETSIIANAGTGTTVTCSVGTLNDFSALKATTGALVVPTWTGVEILGSMTATPAAASVTATLRRGVWILNPNRGGSGTTTITTSIGVDVEDVTATTRLSLRSLGTTTAMEHAGPVRIGDTTAPTQKLEVLGHVLLDNGGTASELRLREPSASGSNYTAFKAQAQAADLTYTLPAADGAGALVSNGSGALSWNTNLTGAHSALSGLTSGDDHTQYLLLAGRAGGQAAIGGTAASELLTLQSTSHATRGTVNLVDEVKLRTSWATISAAQQAISLSQNLTLDNSATALSVLNVTGTWTYTPNAFGTQTIVNVAPTVDNNGSSFATMPVVTGLLYSPTFTAYVAATLALQLGCVTVSPTYGVSGAGTWGAVRSLTAFISAATVNSGTGGARIGLNHSACGGSVGASAFTTDTALQVGALTGATSIGVDVGALAGATLNCALRSAITASAGKRYCIRDTGGADSIFKGQVRLGDTTDPTALLDIVGKTTVNTNGLITKYNNIASAGLGVPATYSESISATKTANFTVFSYTPPSTAGRYRVMGVITTTSSTNTGTVKFTLDYVDSQGTTHTADVIPVFDGAGAFGASGVINPIAASKEYHSVPYEFSINNAGTAIALKVVITGTVSYTVAGTLEQVG